MKDSQLEGQNMTHARTRQGLVGAAVVALVAAVVIVGPHLFGADPDRISAQEPASEIASSSGGTPAVDSHANPCPATPVAVSDSPRTRATLPTDAVMVRLCRARVGPVTSAFQAPTEGLVTDVDAFLARVAQLPQAPAAPCPRVRLTPTPFALRITDSAGRTQTLSSPLTHCGTVTVNSHSVAADALLKLYREALLQQQGG